MEKNVSKQSTEKKEQRIIIVECAPIIAALTWDDSLLKQLNIGTNSNAVETVMLDEI